MRKEEIKMNRIESLVLDPVFGLLTNDKLQLNSIELRKAPKQKSSFLVVLDKQIDKPILVSKSEICRSLSFRTGKICFFFNIKQNDFLSYCAFFY